MAHTPNPVFQLIKTLVILFLLFQVIRAFIPPDMRGMTLNTAESADLEEVLADLETYIGQPVKIESVRVSSPVYFFLGSFYYLESVETGSRIAVLSRAYPPKAGTLISIFGVVQPVVSFSQFNMAFFKPVDWKKAKELEAHLNESTLNN